MDTFKPFLQFMMIKNYGNVFELFRDYKKSASFKFQLQIILIKKGWELKMKL